MWCMLMHGMDHSEHNAPMAAASPQNEPLLDILRRRHALGEITQDQFEEMKRVLGLSESAAAAPASQGHSQH